MVINFNKIESNFNDDNYLRNFFINDLNANVLLFKRLLITMKQKYDQDKLSHLTSKITIQNLLESVKTSNWRESLLVNQKVLDHPTPNKFEGI